MRRQERRARLRSPEQRVGTLPNGDLPPPKGIENVEELLLERALVDGDELAFGDALDRLFSPMMGVALGYVHTRAEAEEVVQDTWLAALRGIARFERRSSLRTWLFRILRNRARTQGSRAARSVPFSDLIGAQEHERTTLPIDRLPGSSAFAGAWPGREVHAQPEPERALLSAELRQQVDRAIDLLPARQREVIRLRDVDGFSAAEVCETLGLSDSNQRVLLHRARSRIRAELADYLDLDEGTNGTGDRVPNAG